MGTFTLERKRKIVIHISVWITFIIFNILQGVLNRGTVELHSLLVLSFNIFIFYFNYGILVPKLLLKEKTFLYVLSVIGLTFLFFAISHFNMPEPPGMHRKFGEAGSENMPPPPDNGPRFFFFLPVIIHLAFIMAGTAIKVYEAWIRNERNRKEVESQKAKTELQFLKNQLNPHFLFNSLNSIYSLTAKKSNDAPEAVITLSELMRYMLFQADQEFVLLKEEVEYIQNYLRLQRLRIANNENVRLNIRGELNQQKIRPLLLISFIENAFKYGTDFKGNTLVKIEIEIVQNELQFKCINIVGRKKRANETFGIGLKNTKEQLNLLYPNRYTLQIDNDSDYFSVFLNLKLD
ncbi:sensor histidine kinase [Zunongwangia pacifica]|uniref:Sensor histidine kinase n=1 Tax=Zunongwangia pacifica TaxID=2911062 RepID=A0A9X2CQK0_9FLAO|nr:sensor histidine kinase [Zunongwangia pacifica]MCL6219933.1 sensor histidine kinase [Zunongwangia pacifica]